MKLPERTRAFITGAGGGFGRALAVELATTRRARVLVSDVNEERAKETVAQVKAAGGEAELLLCDVTRPEELAKASDAMERLFGGTDLLVNNAGVSCAGEVGDVPLADWRWIVDVNLWGVIHGCHAFLPRMKAARAGFILNVASSAGFACLPEMGPYNVTKAGVIALSETLAAELVSHAITVTALCPTFFRTGILESLRSSSERQRELANAMHSRSTVSAGTIAKAALRALEAGRMIEIPQGDGRFAWRVKRLLPQQFSRTMGRIVRSSIFERWMGRNGAPEK